MPQSTAKQQCTKCLFLKGAVLISDAATSYRLITVCVLPNCGLSKNNWVIFKCTSFASRAECHCAIIVRCSAGSQPVIVNIMTVKYREHPNPCSEAIKIPVTHVRWIINLWLCYHFISIMCLTLTLYFCLWSGNSYIFTPLSETMLSLALL